MTHKQLVYSLPHFIHEVAKKDSSPYPAETLHSMVMSFQDALQAQGKEFWFLKDPDFRLVKNTLDNQIKELSSKGKVTAKK